MRKVILFKPCCNKKFAEILFQCFHGKSSASESCLDCTKWI